jgi:phosphoribosylglycinamide formyltransferase-1
MKRIVILFSGEGTNLLNLIDKLEGTPVSIAAAICNRPEAKGIERAKARGVDVDIIDHRLFANREEFDTALVSKIEEYKPDLVVMAGFMRILTPVFTDTVKAINLHPSLLPRFKGTRAIERSFESGDEYGGVSVHWVSGELDGGEVISQRSFKKEEGETLESFTEKIHEIEYELLPETVERICRDG